MGPSIVTYLENLLEQAGLNAYTSHIIALIVISILVLLLAYLADYLTKHVLVVSITRMVRKSKAKWDDALVNRRVMHRL